MAFKHFWVQYKLGKTADQAYIKAESFVIGRAPDCDLPIPTDILSRRHLKVYLEDDKILIQDLGSTNGTFLQGEQLAPNVKYEYKTGNRLYLDSGKECSIRITAIFQRDIIDLDLEQKGLELEKKRHELRSKGRINKALREDDQQENIIASASESIDNVFENLFYIAKSARFNKEKKIREAQNISQELIENAKKEIETNRALLEKELHALQVKVRTEANRVINEANTKSEKLIKAAESKAKKLRQEAQDLKVKAKEEGEQKKQKLIEQGQEKQSKIIAESYLKNQQLIEENEKIDGELVGRRDQKKLLEKEIESLKESFKENDLKTNQSKSQLEEELAKYDEFRIKVDSLERQNADALFIQQQKIPELEKRASELNQKIFSSEVSIKKKETEIGNIEKLLIEKKQEIEKYQEKAKTTEKRLDELAEKIIEAEDNLFKISKIKQQRNEEIDREIQERRSRQKKIEEEALEKIARKKEKSNKEIEVNLANAKEKAINLVQEAEKESKVILLEANEDSNLKIADARKEAKEIIEKSKQEAKELVAKTKKDHEELQQIVDETLSKAKAESEELLVKAKKIKQDTEDEIADRKKSFDIEIEEEKSRLLKDAKDQAQARIKGSEEEAATIIEAAKKEAKRVLSEAKGQANQDLESLQLEIEERKKETDQEIQDIRSQAVRRMEEQKKDFEREEEERNRLRVLRLRKELHDVLRARITPFLKDVEKIDKVDQIINRSINSIMLDEVEDEILEAENYSDIDPSLQQNRVKKFWGAAGAAVVVIILLFTFSSNIEDAVKESGRNIAENIEKQDQEKIDKAKKENDLSAKFEPEMKDEYLSTYTERVMYMKDYLKLEQDPGFKAQWQSELEEFFVDELRLTEVKMVPFVTREAVLITELAEARANINGNFVDQGEERLKKIEDDFFKRIKSGGLKKSQIKKIMKKKQEFFEENKDLFTH